MIVYFIILLFLAFFPIFFPTTTLFLDVKLPFFALSPLFIKGSSIVVSVFLIFSLILFGKRNHFSSFTSKMICYSLLTLFLQFLYFLLLFLGNHLFLCATTMVFVFSSCLFLYEEISKLDERSTRFLNPFVLWSLYLTSIAITAYLLEVT